MKSFNFVFIALMFAVLVGAYWSITCLILYLITILFNIEFNLAVATGICLLFLLLRMIFK